MQTGDADDSFVDGAHLSAQTTRGQRSISLACGLGSLTWKLTFLKGTFSLLTRLPSGLHSISKGRHWKKEKAAEAERTQISNIFCFVLTPENFVCAGSGVRLSLSQAPTCVPPKARPVVSSCEINQMPGQVVAV